MTSDTGTHIDPSDSLGAVVNGPEMVQLYNAQRTILVPQTDVDSFVTEGWTRSIPVEPREAAKELRVLAEAMLTAFDDLIEEVETAGHVDPEKALGVAHTAFAEMAATATNVLHSLQTIHPVKQGDGVRVTRPNAVEGERDDEMLVDPGQVALYEADGWKAV